MFDNGTNIYPVDDAEIAHGLLGELKLLFNFIFVQD